MDENIELNNDYIIGFNEGYILNQFDPSFTSNLSKQLGESERCQGFKDGMTEWDKNKKDLVQDKDDLGQFQDNKKDIAQGIKTSNRYMPKFLRPDRLNEINKAEPDKDLDKDKD